MNDSVGEITKAWEKLKAPTFEEKCEIARAFSDEIEYDEEKLLVRLELYGSNV